MPPASRPPRAVALVTAGVIVLVTTPNFAHRDPVVQADPLEA